MPWLELRSLGRSFAPVRRGGPDVVVGPLDLVLEPGECLAVVGPSGSGKTTLLRLVAGLETPSSGSIQLEGRDISKTPAHQRPFALVSQEGALYPQKSVRDNILFALERRAVEKPEERLREMVLLLRLEDRLDHFPSMLSGGERQRAALARALAVRPQLLLLDEPLAGLDAPLRLSLRREIAPLLAGLGLACLWVTHDQVEAFAVGRRIAVMRKGRIAQTARPVELMAQPCDAFVAAFAGEPPMNMLRGAVVAEGDGYAFVLEKDGGQLALPPGLEPSRLIGKEAVLGIREHHLSIVPEERGALRGTVVHVEHAGREWVTLVSLGGQTAAVRAASPRPVGDKVHLQIDWDKARLFASD